jgi:hypothetical protein
MSIPHLGNMTISRMDREEIKILIAKPKTDFKKTCFIICPIGDKDTKIRYESDMVLNHIITPVVNELGYSSIRADQISKPGIVTRQIIDYLDTADLVIADLSGMNANVFYELAVRHITQKPCIHMIRSGQTIPFDVASNRTIYYDLDIASGEKAKIELKRQISTIHQNGTESDNPISNAFTLKNFKEKASTDGSPLIQILDTLSDMKSEIFEIKQKIAEANPYSFNSPFSQKIMGGPEEQYHLSLINQINNEISISNRKKSDLQSKINNNQSLTKKERAILGGQLDTVESQIQILESEKKKLESALINFGILPTST